MMVLGVTHYTKTRVSQSNTVKLNKNESLILTRGHVTSCACPVYSQNRPNQTAAGIQLRCKLSVHGNCLTNSDPSPVLRELEFQSFHASGNTTITSVF